MMSGRLSNDIRKRFVDYFKKHGHTFVPSSPVKPMDDKSLSFVNAGMNQFRSMILADLATYEPSRICNYQKCIRVGGKMCDLDLIGRDFTHHTFFEMLGNWSFNDYGKEHACEWALDFMVNHLDLNEDKIVVTFHADDRGEDSQTHDIWTKKLGLGSERVIANSKGDNFWEMGPHGPCGMSTEIYYPVGNNLEEIWNLVFIDRQRLEEDPQRLVPLRGLFIDTGMGLERILSVIEKTSSNYDTDLFKSLFDIVRVKSPDVRPYTGSLHDDLDINYRILVDHCRMITIALADGVEPGRKGAEFMLRSLIKKSVDLAKDVFKQKVPRYLLFDLFDEIVIILGDAYPDLKKNIKMIRRVLAHESKRHIKHLESLDKVTAN